MLNVIILVYATKLSFKVRKSNFKAQKIENLL